MTAAAPALDNPQAVCARVLRYELREVARKYSRGRVKTCGHALGHGVALQTLADGSGALGGIETCSSVWACPVCSARIGMGRREELIKLVAWAKQEGLHVSFLTLTQRHNPGDRLKDLWKRISLAWRRLYVRTAFVSFKRQVGWRGYVRAMEVTHGAHGWHVHAHYLILTEKPLTGLVEVYQRGKLTHETVHHFIGSRWEETIRKLGGDVIAGAGVDLREVSDGTEEIVAQYVGKSGSDIGLEMAMGSHKRGRKKNRTPFQILADLKDSPTTTDRNLWREWETSSRGQLHLVWSNGLKAEAGLVEMSDEEVAEQGEKRETHGFISRADYHKVLESGLVPELLEAIENNAVDIGNIIGVGHLRLVVYRDIGDVPKMPTGWRRRNGVPLHVMKEEGAWNRSRVLS